MSRYVEHAHHELLAAGLLDQDSDYRGQVGIAVEQLIEVFAAQGHSGGSAWMTLELFSKLAEFKPLSPLTDRPSEWVDHSSPAHPLWQSSRQSDAFSEDGGRTYYILSEQRRWVRWPILNNIRSLRRIKLMYPIHTSEPSGFIIGVAE